jgi:hypothetical protein
LCVDTLPLLYLRYWPIVRDTVAYFIALFFLGMLTLFSSKHSEIGVLPCLILITYYCAYVLVALYVPKFIDVGYNRSSDRAKSVLVESVSGSEEEPLLKVAHPSSVEEATTPDGSETTAMSELWWEGGQKGTLHGTAASMLVGYGLLKCFRYMMRATMPTPPDKPFLGAASASKTFLGNCAAFVWLGLLSEFIYYIVALICGFNY